MYPPAPPQQSNFRSVGSESRHYPVILPVGVAGWSPSGQRQASLWYWRRGGGAGPLSARRASGARAQGGCRWAAATHGAGGGRTRRRDTASWRGRPEAGTTRSLENPGSGRGGRAGAAGARDLRASSVYLTRRGVHCPVSPGSSRSPGTVFWLCRAL